MNTLKEFKNLNSKEPFILDGNVLGIGKEEWDICWLDIENCQFDKLEIRNFPKLILYLQDSKIGKLKFDNCELFANSNQDYSFIHNSTIQVVEKGKNNKGFIECMQKSYLLDIKDDTILFTFEELEEDFDDDEDFIGEVSECRVLDLDNEDDRKEIKRILSN